MKIHLFGIAIVGAAVLSIAACNVFKAADQNGSQTAAANDLKTACADYSLVRAGLGLAAFLPQPGAAVVGVIEAAVDPVCADQAKFAGDLSTVVWLFKNINALRGQFPTAASPKA